VPISAINQWQVTGNKRRNYEITKDYRDQCLISVSVTEWVLFCLEHSAPPQETR